MRKKENKQTNKRRDKLNNISCFTYLQEHSSTQEKAKRTLDTQIAELEHRLTEANEVAAKGGRNAMAKLESRIRELEIELGSVQSRTSETYKSFQKSERRIKELQFQQEEDHKNQV